MGKNGSPAVGGRTAAAAAAATVADATIGLAWLLVAMVMTGATPGELERSSGGGVDAVVVLGGARWMTDDPCCWLGSWVCSDSSGAWRGVVRGREWRRERVAEGGREGRKSGKRDRCTEGEREGRRDGWKREWRKKGVEEGGSQGWREWRREGVEWGRREWKRKE